MVETPSGDRTTRMPPSRASTSRSRKESMARNIDSTIESGWNLNLTRGPVTVLVARSAARRST